jgi:Reverse transcriptase (RNA-dependent DNA polymerase)
VSFADAENITFEQAIKNEKWQTAMQEEMKAIEKNDT